MRRPRDPVELAKADMLPQLVKVHIVRVRKIGGYVFHAAQFKRRRAVHLSAKRTTAVERSTTKRGCGQHEDISEHAEITTSAWQPVGCTVHGYADGENKNKTRQAHLLGILSAKPTRFLPFGQCR